MTKKLLLLVLCAFSLGNLAASDLDFTLANATNLSFEAVYISATTDKDWDGNILSQGKSLTPGGNVTVRFERNAKSETWDLKIVDSEGLAVTFEKLNLSGADKVTLKDVHGKITAEVE
jgi:hypothetical protein